MPETNRVPAGGAARPLDGCHVVVAGCGRVGASFGHWLISLGARLTVSGRRRGAAAETLLERGARWRPLATLESADADLLLIAVADDVIASLARQLATARQAPCALHVSGHHDAGALSALRSHSCATGSLHPLRAFTEVSRDLGDVAGTTFAIDGDPPATAMAERLASALGGTAFEVSGERRVLYHLAASLAAGGVMTILAAVERLSRSADLPPGLMASYLHLTRGALEHLPPSGEAVATAITGPAARGDRAVLDRQHAAVKHAAPELLPLLDGLNRLTETFRRDIPT